MTAAVGPDPEGIVMTFPVAREHDGMRLDRFIQLRIPRLSRTRAATIVRSCAYREDGTLRRASDRVRAGEVVTLVRPRFEEPPAPLSFVVLYEDDDVVAIDKPAGLPMHPTATYHRHTLTHLLREKHGDHAPAIAHRLDRETSGIVLCGKHLDAERTLKIAFERRRVHKTYLAIVRGEIATDEGRIDLPLASVREGLHILMEVRDDGETSIARTRYQVRARRAGASLVELFPETGRQHQLRVHLASIGHPILGDKLYGPEGHQPFLEFIEGGMTDELRGRLGHDRHALHAHRTELAHPRTASPLVIECPLPPDLVALWDGAGGL